MNILSNWLRSYLPELSVNDRQLAEDLTLRGIAVEGIFDLGSHGSLFEMDITTNRVDAMNHYGIAREIAAIYNLSLRQLQIICQPLSLQRRHIPSPSKPPNSADASPPASSATSRSPHPTASSPNASACSNKSSSPTPSTQPTSSLSPSASPLTPSTSTRSKAESSSAAPAKAKSFALLMASSAILDPEDLIVADHAKPLAIAGVMGGWDSMITPETKNILVEAAWFDPGTVRRSSRRHGLHTDASHRFERGADFNAAPIANALVSQLVLEAGGEIEGELVDVIVPEAQARTANRSGDQPPGQRSPAHPRQNRSSRRHHRRGGRVGPHVARLQAARNPAKEPTPSPSPAGVSISNARSTSSKRSPASTATTASPTHCRLRRLGRRAALGREGVDPAPHPPRPRLERSRLQHLLLCGRRGHIRSATRLRRQHGQSA